MTYPNWFESTTSKENFERHLLPLANTALRCVQIGAYTGDATKWMVDNILQHESSRLIDVDTWEGSDEAVHKNMDWKDVWNTYYEKNKQAIEDSKVLPTKKRSDVFFATSGGGYDFIYIDADHTAFGVLRDGMNAYEQTVVGGIIAFDDYGWSEGKGDFYQPRYAIDALCHLLNGKVEKIEDNYQIWLRKII
jgi:Methyltransferase domain